MFIMLMQNKLVITHTEHRACDIYERRDTAGMVGTLFYSSSLSPQCVCVFVCVFCWTMRQMDSLKLSKISQDSNNLLKKNDLMDSTNIWQTYASLFLAHVLNGVVV